MTSSDSFPKRPTPLPQKMHGIAEEEGLLSGISDVSSKYYDLDPPLSRAKIIAAAIFFITLPISLALVRSLYCRPALPSNHNHSIWFSGEGDLRSNGTHDFKRTVVIVSIDGLRADYLDRGLTPHLLGISENGLRAKSMRPVFPTLTFPNHWSLMTGLYAESHGIVANNFWDPNTKKEFHYNRIEIAWQSEWWFGEPMWETASKAGLITANLMWPGPPKTTSGVTPEYYIPWRDHVPLNDKHDQIMSWIDLPIKQRPQLIMAYDPSLDQAGHATGPFSALVNQTLDEVDAFAKKLRTSLQTRNLTDIVDIVFVSDHGMTDTSHLEPVYVDDIIGEEGLRTIEHEDGWPSMGLWFRESANVSYYLDALENASYTSPEKFSVYTHETMPERYHFRHNERIAPIYVLPKIGYILTTRTEGDTGMSKGNHGYDNEANAMQAVFIAHGPFTSDMKALHQSGNKPNDNWHSAENSAYIMECFQNVEVYNLVMKLLGIEEYAANNNGTVGFWNRYL